MMMMMMTAAADNATHHPSLSVTSHSINNTAAKNPTFRYLF